MFSELKRCRQITNFLGKFMFRALIKTTFIILNDSDFIFLYSFKDRRLAYRRFSWKGRYCIPKMLLGRKILYTEDSLGTDDTAYKQKILFRRTILYTEDTLGTADTVYTEETL